MAEAKRTPNTTSSRTKPKDLLARAFLDILTARDGNKSKSMLHGQNPNDLEDDTSIVDMLDDLSDDDSSESNLIQPHIAAAAILVARAIETTPGLIRQLKRKNPTVSLHVPEIDYIHPVRQVLIDCALPEVQPQPSFGRLTREERNSRESFTVCDRYSICVRDGNSKEHNSTTGNEMVAQQVFAGRTLIGISTDPKRHLPRDLMRIAEHHLRLPSLDTSALALIIESTTGQVCEQDFDEQILRLVTSADLSLSIRKNLTPQECIERLYEVIAKKDEYGTSGPNLEELFGYGRAKEWGLGLISDITEFKSGNLDWSDFDHRGLLLTGMPGTGKTSFARALAKSANIPIIATSVSQWNATGDHLGHTLQAMRSAFHRAQQASPAILFIDELDGISSRSTLDSKYREYWLQIVNQLLELMQGFEEREGVVLIAATNHPEQIDPAILRAGRLDRTIHVELPDTHALRDIFRFYLTDALKDTELMPLAIAARGKSGADAEAYVTRAKAHARRAKRPLELKDILSEIRDGRGELSEEMLRLIAVHEAGHAVASLHYGLGNLESVEIGDYGGSTVHQIDLDTMQDQSSLANYLVVLMAGAAAEESVIGKACLGSSAGPNNDLVKATQIASQLELAWQVGKPAPITFALSHETALLALPELRDRVQMRLSQASGMARKLIQTRRTQVEKIAHELVLSHYLSGEEVCKLYNANQSNSSLRQIENA